MKWISYFKKRKETSFLPLQIVSNPDVYKQLHKRGSGWESTSGRRPSPTSLSLAHSTATKAQEHNLIISACYFLPSFLGLWMETIRVREMTEIFFPSHEIIVHMKVPRTVNGLKAHHGGEPELTCFWNINKDGSLNVTSHCAQKWKIPACHWSLTKFGRSCFFCRQESHKTAQVSSHSFVRSMFGYN